MKIDILVNTKVNFNFFMLGHCFIEKVNGVQSSKVAEKFEDERNIFKSFIKN